MRVDGQDGARMRRVQSAIAWVTLGAALGACARASTVPAATQAAGATRAPMEIPESVGAFRRIAVRPVRGAPNDTNYRFDNGAGVGISVFRYAIPADVQRDRDTVAWIRREGEKFPVVQRILVSRGVADSMKVRLSMLNPARPEFPLAEYVGVVQTWSARHGVMIESEYIYVVDGRFLKIRASEPDAVEGGSQAAQFARQLLRSMLTAASAP